ncbi:MAG TPA: hypothetical protein DEB63_03450 [Agrobacterium sp.]|nr:hypothetical protein [Agrobacterium sp.]
MPSWWSGVASAPDGRHGLPISPVSGTRKGGLRIALFLCRPCHLGGLASQAHQTGGMDSQSILSLK